MQMSILIMGLILLIAMPCGQHNYDNMDWCVSDAILLGAAGCSCARVIESRL